jgi:hypothetical protein
MKRVLNIILAVLTFVLTIVVGLYWNRFIPNPYPVRESTKVLITVLILAPTFILGLVTGKWYYVIASLSAYLIVQFNLEGESPLIRFFALIYWWIILVAAFFTGILFRIFIKEIWNR